MRLTKQTTYALRILLHCAAAGDSLVKAADIARASRITEFNALKIIPLLAHGGFVETTRGRRGGLRLAQPPAQIRVGDVVRITEPARLKDGGIGRHDDDAGAPPPVIERILGDALDAFLDVLDGYTLQDLLDGAGSPDTGSPPAAAKSAAREGRAGLASAVPK